MLYALGVLIFAVGLLASIALHEIGHLVPAKKFGVKVTQYMVGFGPTMWSRKRGETEYGVKAIPAGGYIRMIGMVPPRADGSRSRWPRRLATAVEDFRAMSRAEVQPGDEDREFYRLTPGKKIIVMLGGPTMNLLIYLVLMIVLLGTLGVGHQDVSRTIQSVSQCVVPATENAPTACPTDAPLSPAAKAGIQPGDTIESINGRPVASWAAATAIIETSPGKPLAMVVSRNGSDVALTVTPVKNKRQVGTGSKTETVGFIGVTAYAHDYYTPLPVSQIPGKIVSQLAASLHAIGNYPAKVHNLWQTVFDGKPRDANGAVGVVGIGRIGGDIASSPSFDVQDKLVSLIGLLASVNLLLFLFNLLPLLPLDGGHVAGAIVEAAKRGRARLRYRRAGPDDADAAPRRPIFVDTAQMLPIMYAVASVLIVLTVLTLYADIVKPITLPRG